MHTRWQVVRQQAGPDPWGCGGARLVCRAWSCPSHWQGCSVVGGRGYNDSPTFSEAVFIWVTLTLSQCLSLLPSWSSAPLVNMAQKAWGQLGL